MYAAALALKKYPKFVFFFAGDGEQKQELIQLCANLVNIAQSPALAQSLKDGVTKEYTKISWNDVAGKCLKAYDAAADHRQAAE